ncbi:hypothetical protein [uncultured Chryseobacterium sp.]|uniref:hypothetical protein n=1 Tax=uncultured Chryseobacterium sp. TaxID=259322 RepID=UPI0025EC3FE7|nr:hypothetical protein [uncultured Chryseobacterium sp.]
MSKFLPEKKRLLEEVYEKASNATTDTSFSAILKNLEVVLRDEHRITLSYKTIENYYKAIVKEESDYPTKHVVLDDLSRYLGYNNFNEYCAEWKTIEHTIQQAISKIIITIINKPIFTMPDFLKKNGMGIVEMAFVILLVSGGVVFSSGKKQALGIASLWGTPAIEKPYMYWDKDRYIASDSSYINPQIEVVPMEPNKFVYQKKITRPDTLTIENAVGKVWYDKSNSHVEFFTNYGEHPENGKTLKVATVHIVETYGGANATEEFADN